jgi:hypothetical protein
VNQLYDVAVALLLTGGLDLDTDPLAVAVGDAVTFDRADTDVDALGGLVLDINRPALVGRSVSDNALHADDIVVTYTGAGEPIATSLVVYRSDDDVLVAYLDTRPDLLPFSVPLTEGPVRFSWAGGVVVAL